MLAKTTLILMIASIFSCSTQPPLSTVSNVEISKYAGKWYEIARLPNSFEKELDCVSATYSLIPDSDKIKVLNQGRKSGTKQKSITGKAWVPDENESGRLKVSFFWPFAGDYYIIALDDDYKYALVGSPSRKFLWILSKTKIMDQNVYENYLSIAREKGFDTNDLILVNQDCE